MSILDSEDRLLNKISEVPILSWLDKSITMQNGKIEIDDSEEIPIVNIMKSNKHDLFVYLEETVTNIPVDLFRFGRIEGNFICSDTILESLKGSPRIVEGMFNCSGCKKLTNTDGCPIWIGDDLIFAGCHNLKEITDIPKMIGHDLNCQCCYDLKDISNIKLNEIHIGNFDFGYCKNITTLPKFPSRFAGYIDITKCTKLGKDEYFKLPDNILGNLYMDSVVFENMYESSNDQYGETKNLLIFKNDDTEEIFKCISLGGEVYT